MKFSLTEKQKEIVDYLDGALLVTAGPGSGKTRVLTQRIINILEHNKGNVLALTFSNKAAQEISDRIKENITTEEYLRVNVGTIHSFCLEIITNKGKQIGLPSGLSIIESTSDKLDLLKKVVNNTLSQRFDDKEFRRILGQIQKYKQSFILPEMVDKNITDFNIINLYEGYNNILLENRMIDFDDILYYAYKILLEKPKVASNYTRLYKYIMIDEAQDLNETQYKVIKALTRNFTNLMMVGDPAQSIYGFNGSNSSIMTQNFVADYNPVKFFLKENFRSTSKIIEAANKIQPDSESESVYPLEGVLQAKSFRNKDEEAEWIVDKISDLLENGSKWIDHPISLENIGIIGRNRYVFTEIENLLEDKKIDFSMGNNGSNLESETVEMKIFEIGMRVLVNPFDDLHYTQLVHLLGRDKKEDFLNDLLNNTECTNVNVNPIILNAVVQSWNMINNDVEKFSKALENIRDATENITSDENFIFLLINDIDLWKNRWNMYIKESVSGARSLAYFRNQVSLGKLNLGKSGGISLLTVHMSKGLEFDIIFVVELTEGTFPDYRATSHKEMKEERNNMFVAITRAKRECYLTYPLEKMMPLGTSRKQRKSSYLDIINL